MLNIYVKYLDFSTYMCFESILFMHTFTNKLKKS